MKTNLSRRFGWIAGEACEEDGVALVTVVAFSAILFMLITTLIMLAVQQQVTTTHVAARSGALALADAGVSAFEQNLKLHAQDTSITIGPTTTSNGNWTVSGAPGADGQSTVITSIGKIPGSNETRKVVAVVRTKSFGDYAVAMSGDYDLGTGGTVNGDVSANGKLTNGGTITGYAYYGTSWGGSGVYKKGTPIKQTINFADIDLDMTAMKTLSQFYGTYVAPSGTGCLGYDVVLNGDTLTYQKVTAVNSSTGVLTYSGAATTMNIPDPALNTAIYFDDEIWIKGNYSKSVTIATPSNQMVGAKQSPYNGAAIYITGNIKPTVNPSTAVMGLVAKGDIILPTWYTATKSAFSGAGTEWDVWCSVLSQNGVFDYEGDGSSFSPQWPKLYFLGSRTAATGGGFSAVFANRTYEYDNRLRSALPPAYPKLHTGELTLVNWNEF